MLSDEAKKTIDELPREQLLEEVNKGNRSRFQGEKFAYLKARLALLDQQESQQHLQRQLNLDTEANEIARTANELAQEANTTSSKAYRMSFFSVVATPPSSGNHQQAGGCRSCRTLDGTIPPPRRRIARLAA